MRSVIAVIIGILTAFVVGSVIGTQVVLASVQSMGLDVTLAMRWSTSLSDVVGLSSSLLPLMAIALGCSWALLIWLEPPQDSARQRAVVRGGGRGDCHGAPSGTQSRIRCGRLRASAITRGSGRAGAGRGIGRYGHGSCFRSVPQPAGGRPKPANPLTVRAYRSDQRRPTI